MMVSAELARYLAVRSALDLLDAEVDELGERYPERAGALLAAIGVSLAEEAPLRPERNAAWARLCGDIVAGRTRLPNGLPSEIAAWLRAEATRLEQAPRLAAEPPAPEAPRVAPLPVTAVVPGRPVPLEGGASALDVLREARRVAREAQVIAETEGAAGDRPGEPGVQS